MMKKFFALMKKQHILALLLAAILGLTAVNAVGIFTVFVVSDPYTVLEIVLGFLATFLLFCGGVVFMNYEGRGTPLNMALNGLFYLFLIAAIVSLILLLIRAFRRSSK